MFKRLFGPAQLTAAAATKYTVPAGLRAIIRHMHFSNTSAAPRTITVSIGADAAGTRLYDARVIAAGDTYDHYGLDVMEAAEILQAYADLTGVIVMTVNGELEAA